MLHKGFLVETFLCAAFRLMRFKNSFHIHSQNYGWYKGTHSQPKQKHKNNSEPIQFRIYFS